MRISILGKIPAHVLHSWLVPEDNFTMGISPATDAMGNLYRSIHRLSTTDASRRDFRDNVLAVGDVAFSLGAFRGVPQAPWSYIKKAFREHDKNISDYHRGRKPL